MGKTLYEYCGGIYRVAGRNGMMVVLQEVNTGTKIEVSGKKFMSSEFQVCCITKRRERK